MEIRKNFRDIHLVDANCKTEYFHIGNTEFFDLDPDILIGMKPQQNYKNLNDENSALMQVLKTGEAILNYVQELITLKGKRIRQEADHFCVRNGEEIIGALEIAYYDEEKDTLYDGRNSSNDIRKYSSDTCLSLDDIVAESDIMKTMKRKLAKAASVKSPILLTGESGTGKEMTARVLHNISKQKNGEFVYVNCGALPENLIESILFGTDRGSFTDATERKGLFMLADRGTIFLDEIQSMPLETQGKILRVLEEKRIRPVGSDMEIPIDTRVIASCNLKPEELLSKESLRTDLYFRLAVIQFDLPPLRMRKTDVLPIAEYYLKMFNEKFEDKKILDIEPEACKFLLKYDWPGNIRELRNTIESAFYMANDNILRMKDIEKRFSMQNEAKHEETTKNVIAETFLQSGENLQTFLHKYEKECVRQAVLQAEGNLKKAAQQLKISPQMMKYYAEKFLQSDEAELEGED